MAPDELERRREQAERRQSYRGDRKRKYKPRDGSPMRGQYHQVTFLVTPAQKEYVSRRAAELGMSRAEWWREILDDLMRIDASSDGTG